MTKRLLTPQEEMDAIRLKMGHFRLVPKVSGYLDTESEYLNAVLGKPGKGLPWGRILELFGPESNGKTAIAYFLAKQAQKAGAHVVWYDAENAWTNQWAKLRGVDVKKVHLIRPYLGFFDGRKPKYDDAGKLLNEPTLSPAEVLVDEALALCKILNRKDGKPILFVTDSVTALETLYEQELGMEGANMRSKTSLAEFLSRMMKRCVSRFQVCNVLGVVINQLRVAPGVVYGNPEYTPGGKAVKFYAHMRIRIGRNGGGKLMQGSRQVGIKGTMKVMKSKVGGVEGTLCGYKIYYDGRYAFMDAKEIKSKKADL